jgi:hypothetical protein
MARGRGRPRRDAFAAAAAEGAKTAKKEKKKKDPNAPAPAPSASAICTAFHSSKTVRIVPSDITDPNSIVNDYLERNTDGVMQVPQGQIDQYRGDDAKKLSALIFAYNKDGEPIEGTMQLYPVRVMKLGCPHPTDRKFTPDEPLAVRTYYAARPNERTVLVKRVTEAGAWCSEGFVGIKRSLIRVSPCLLFWKKKE